MQLSRMNSWEVRRVWCSLGASQGQNVLSKINIPTFIRTVPALTPLGIARSERLECRIRLLLLATVL